MKMGAYLTWSISNNKFLISYYYNNNNIDLSKKLSRLNIIANNSQLSKKGWKLLFRVEKFAAEKWNYDFAKEVEVIVKR